MKTEEGSSFKPAVRGCSTDAQSVYSSKNGSNTPAGAWSVSNRTAPSNASSPMRNRNREGPRHSVSHPGDSHVHVTGAPGIRERPRHSASHPSDSHVQVAGVQAAGVQVTGVPGAGAQQVQAHQAHKSHLADTHAQMANAPGAGAQQAQQSQVHQAHSHVQMAGTPGAGAQQSQSQAHQAHQAHKGHGGGTEWSPRRGGGLGLSTVARAATAVYGHAWLTSSDETRPDGARPSDSPVITTFHALLPASLPVDFTPAESAARNLHTNVGLRSVSEGRAIWNSTVVQAAEAANLDKPPLVTRAQSLGSAGTTAWRAPLTRSSRTSHLAAAELSGRDALARLVEVIIYIYIYIYYPGPSAARRPTDTQQDRRDLPFPMSTRAFHKRAAPCCHTCLHTCLKKMSSPLFKKTVSTPVLHSCLHTLCIHSSCRVLGGQALQRCSLGALLPDGPSLATGAPTLPSGLTLTPTPCDALAAAQTLSRWVGTLGSAWTQSSSPAESWPLQDIAITNNV